jgi:hypothetical protein
MQRKSLRDVGIWFDCDVKRAFLSLKEIVDEIEQDRNWCQRVVPDYDGVGLRRRRRQTYRTMAIH